MPPRCFLGCPDLAGKHLHVFPNPKRFPDQFNKWVDIVGGQLNTPEDYAFFVTKRLCDKHFTEKDRNRNNRLNALAVPSLFLKGEPADHLTTSTTVSETLAEIDVDVPLLQANYLIRSLGGEVQDMNREQSIRLIQLYGEHRLLWDQKDPNHLISKKRKECWIQITNEMKLPVNVLRKKMKSLLGTHRRERNREKISHIRGAKRIYTSNWFGYPYFDFIRNRSRQVKTLHAIRTDDSRLSPQTSNEDTNETSSPELRRPHTVLLVEESPHRILPSSLQPSRKQRHNSPEASQEELLDSDYEDTNVVKDPYISFGNHIASELRKYDPRTLACVKHAINNIIFEADMGRIEVITSDHLPHHSPQITKLSSTSTDSSGF